MTVSTQQQWQTVCQLTDLIPQSGVAAKINNRQIALFYIPEHNRVYAIDNYCPFAEANVLARGIVGDLNEQLIVASPLYKQHFNLQTGACLEDDSVKVACYPTKIDNDSICISV
ncbi:MAG: nitrite reductase small subunit NirD [Reinekea sp.]|jgi:nitrite reductase (NADH) small subunit